MSCILCALLDHQAYSTVIFTLPGPAPRAAAATATACFLYLYNALWTSFPATKIAHTLCRSEAEIVRLTLPAYIDRTSCNSEMSRSTQGLPILSPRGSEYNWSYSTFCQDDDEEHNQTTWSLVMRRHFFRGLLVSGWALRQDGRLVSVLWRL